MGQAGGKQVLVRQSRGSADYSMMIRRPVLHYENIKDIPNLQTGLILYVVFLIHKLDTRSLGVHWAPTSSWQTFERSKHSPRNIKYTLQNTKYMPQDTKQNTNTPKCQIHNPKYQIDAEKYEIHRHTPKYQIHNLSRMLCLLDMTC